MSREIKFRQFVKALMTVISIIALATVCISAAKGDFSSAWKMAVLSATALIVLKIEV